MAIDFLQFFANFIIACILLRLIQAKFAGTEWGKVAAFIH